MPISIPRSSMLHQMWSDGPDILILCSISSQNSLICMIVATLLEADETTVPKAHIDDWERPTSIFWCLGQSVPSIWRTTRKLSSQSLALICGPQAISYALVACVATPSCSQGFAGTFPTIRATCCILGSITNTRDITEHIWPWLFPAGSLVL